MFKQNIIKPINHIKLIDASTITGTQISNVANIGYSYLANPANPPIDNAVDTNEVLISIVDADLTSSIKSVDKEFADIGDEITYTINVQNTGSIDATNVVVIDTIASTGVSFVPGSVVVDGASSTDDPSTGINVGTISSAQTLVITFKIVVDQIPSPNPILNNANISYDYSIGTDSIPSEYTTENEVSTLINSGGFSGPDGIVKSSDQIEAVVGQNITYNISIKNTGNLDVVNTIIFDTLPIETSFVPGSVSIDGASSTDDPNTGINIGTVKAGQSMNISFEVLVNSQPSSGVLSNEAIINYQYITDPSLPPKDGSNKSNNVQTPIEIMKIEIIKSANKTDVVFGETLTYTITVNNKGTVGVEDVLIKDDLSDKTSFVEGSVSIDGVLDPTQSILDGVLIPLLDVGASSVITFDVRVI